MSQVSYRQRPALATPPSTGTANEMVPPWAAEVTSARPLRGLMICGLFTLAYRAMRCFAAAKVEVYVLGNERSRGMRYARVCAGYTQTPHIFDGNCTAAMIDAVNQAITRHRIDFVFAGDQPSTRSLIMMGGRLRAPLFPMPDLATFDLLNDKARFTALCGRLAVRCPPTQVFENRDGLLEGIAAGSVALPTVIKPLSLDGNRGVIALETPHAAATARIDYRPVLAQDFIDGADIGASVYADRGRVVAYICHRLKRATYVALDQPAVLAALQRIVAATGVSGILNFDMRLAPDGTVYFLECNPRVFYKMNLAMLVGINFAAVGVAAMTGTALDTVPDAPPAVPPAGTAVRSFKAIAAALARPWQITRRDRAMLGYILADPIPYIRENLRIDWEDRSYSDGLHGETQR